MYLIFQIQQEKIMKVFNKWSEKLKQKDSVFLHYTGNMFGIGCSAFQAAAIAKIHNLKQRNSKQGLIVLIPEFSWLEKYQVFVPVKLRRLLQQYWPGELTIILPDPNGHFKHVSVDGYVAFRVPTDALLRNFIVRFGSPIVSTSINRSGNPAQTDLQMIKTDYDNWFDYGFLPKKTRTAAVTPSTILKYSHETLNLVREGAIRFSEIEQSFQKPRILFVCTANICRSPMAEYYLKEKLKRTGLNYEVRSAGFLQSGLAISENSRQVLAENAIDVPGHLSTQLNEFVIRQSWLILTMTINHKTSLIEHFPNAENKTFTLSEYAGFKQDIDDPYGLDIVNYRETFKKVKTRIDVILEKLN